MQRVMAITAIHLGLLFSTAAIADDTKTEPVNDTPVTESVTSTEFLYTSEWRYRMDELDFQDNSPLGRISRMRELSLLTLAETRSSRFFLGVNSEGTFGFHFNAR